MSQGTPRHPRGRLPRARPSEVAVDPAGVWFLLNELERQHIELHSLMLLRHGQVFAEGWRAPYGPDDARLLYSLSKSFTSAAVGLVVGDGLVGYDDRLVDLFSDVVDAGRVGPVAATIRVRDCLAMATGHRTDLVPTQGLDALPGRKPWARSLMTEPDGTPGSTFCYNQWATWTLAEIVRAACGRDVLALLTERLFTPLGIVPGTWDRDAQGRTLGYSGLHLSTEAVASFFQLLADGGVRDGVRLLPEEWIAEHARAHTDNSSETNPDWRAGYGWQFWRNAVTGYRGDGAFGQFGLVLPDQDAVLVLHCASESMQEVLDAVWRHLLPAFDRTPTLEDHHLADRLGRLRLTPVEGERGGHADLVGSDGTRRWHLTDDAEGWQLRWVDERGENMVAIGHDAWRHGTMTWPCGTLPIAASGAWVGWGHFVTRIAALNTPHSVVLHLRDDGRGLADWTIAPLGKRATLWALAVEAGSG